MLDLAAFLDAHVDETIWLRAAVRAGGVNVVAGDAGVAAHDGRGVLHVHGAAGGLAAAARVPGRPLIAICGPPAAVEDARAELGIAAAAVRHLNPERHFGLSLDALVVPARIASGALACRRATDADLPLLVDWRLRYEDTVHGEQPAEDVVAAEVRRQQAAGLLWVLLDDGATVATCSFQAVFPTVVQLEHGFVPPDLRSKGYIRCAAAGSLLAARAGGVRRGVVYTHEANVATQAAIRHLGFVATGDYAVATL